MMREVPVITAVVVTHNRPDELRLVIRALQAQTFPLARVLVVDNASPLPAVDVLAGFSGVEIIRNDNNTGGAGGFAFALDTALKLGSGWVWMMDDDAVPRADALAALVEAAGHLPATAGALCSAVYEFDALAPMHRRTFSKRFGVERPIPVARYGYDYIEIDTGSFVGFMVRSQAALEIGLPDANFFLAYDDTEYSLRLKSKGWSIWLVPGSKVDHLRGAISRLRGSAFGAKHFYNIRNRLFVARRYSRFGSVPAFFVGLLILFAARQSFSFKSFKLFCCAVIDGYRGRLGVLRDDRCL